jgi:NADH/NAD ratio-sensing transcriptional regulator Rex
LSLPLVTLGLKIIKKFTLSKDISNKIFNIEKETEVTVLGKGDLSMEIFKSNKTSHNDFQHVCITVNNRENVIQKPGRIIIPALS